MSIKKLQKGNKIKKRVQTIINNQLFMILA